MGVQDSQVSASSERINSGPTGASAQAQAQTRLDQADETATALGCKHDTAQVDAKKYPAHRPEQKCNNCQFWQGAAGDAWAGCSMAGRQQIAAAGWCLACRKVA